VDQQRVMAQLDKELQAKNKTFNFNPLSTSAQFISFSPLLDWDIHPYL
jgi:hypothetical protein